MCFIDLGWWPTGSNPAMRDGNWNDNARNCRSANRNNNNPDNRNNNIGFRAVLAPAQSRRAGLTRPPSCPWTCGSGAKSGETRPGVSSGAESSRRLRAFDAPRRVEPSHTARILTTFLQDVLDLKQPKGKAPGFVRWLLEAHPPSPHTRDPGL